MTAAELIEFLSAVPGSTPIRASYDCGCAWGPVTKANRIIVMSSGEIEVELEVE